MNLTLIKNKSNILYCTVVMAPNALISLTLEMKLRDSDVNFKTIRTLS